MSTVKQYPFGFSTFDKVKDLTQLRTYLKQELDALARYLQKNLNTANIDVAAEIAAIEAAIAAIEAKILFSLTQLAITTTGSSTLPAAGTHFRYFLTITGGAPYTYTISLAEVGRQTNDTIIFNFFTPASTDPTIVFEDEGTSTTLLNLTFAGLKENATEIEFFWDGSQWQLGTVNGDSIGP